MTQLAGDGTLENGDAKTGPLVAELYRKYSIWLHRALRRQGNGDSSEDIVQETYIRASRYPAAALKVHPQALLLKIAQNITRNAARRDSSASRIYQALQNKAEGHREAVGLDQFHAVLFEEILTDMPRLQREAFVLSRFRGLTNQEIAETLGISVKSVERRMTEALKFCDARMRD